MSTPNKALGIAVELLAAHIKEVWEGNEGFDGEVGPEKLAEIAIRSLAVKMGAPAPKPMTRAEAVGGIATNPHLLARQTRPHARKPVSCKYGLSWAKGEGGRWTLLNEDGSRHTCRREARQAQVETSQPETQESFAETLRKV